MKKLLATLAVLCLCLLAIPTQKADAVSVKLDKTKVTVYEQKKATIKVKGTKKKVTWKSSNTKIATVKDGVVTGKKKGTAKITAKVNGKSYTCKVTVKKAELSNKSVTLTEGSSKKISLKGAYKKVTYKSNNKKIVTVKNGTIKAVAPGKTTVTVFHNGKKYTCKVTVNDKIIDLKLDKTLFNDKEIKAELSKEMTIKSTKVKGNYVIYKVTKRSYDKCMKKLKAEIDKQAKTFANSTKMVSKATVNSKCNTLNIYITDSESDEDNMNTDVLGELVVNAILYQGLSGVTYNKIDLKVDYYDAATKKLMFNMSLKDFLEL